MHDGIIRSVRVGYRVYKFEETTGKGANALPVRKAIDWEPFEVSMVPIPADAGAKVRSGSADANPCEIVAVRGEEKPSKTAEEKKILDPGPGQGRGDEVDHQGRQRDGERARRGANAGRSGTDRPAHGGGPSWTSRASTSPARWASATRTRSW